MGWCRQAGSNSNLLIANPLRSPLSYAPIWTEFSAAKVQVGAPLTLIRVGNRLADNQTLLLRHTPLV